jgi:NDP-sugar pyrophosphorylase family protein
LAVAVLLEWALFIIGNNTKIGFNCEISRTYFQGNDEMAHHNLILDSIIGNNVWFGLYLGTANVLLNKKNIRYEIDERELVDMELIALEQ